MSVYVYTLQISVDIFLVAARHQWVRGWCRHRALEHMQELLELQAEQGVGLVEVVTKLGIILKKGLRCILFVCVQGRSKAIQTGPVSFPSFVHHIENKCFETIRIQVS